MTLIRQWAQAVEAQRGYLFPWAPVCLACGIGSYFALLVEPGRITVATLAIVGIALCIGALRLRDARGLALMAGCLMVAGLLLGIARAQSVAGPVLEYRYYGPIEGRLVGLDRSSTDRKRLTLDRVVLKGIPPQDTPRRVRVSLHAKTETPDFTPGSVLILTGHLSPPPGPAEPGGFDFRRHAWFLGLGGVGYTRTPVLRLERPSNTGPAVWITDLRFRISAYVRRSIPGEAGGFAAAVLTGDRSGVGQETLANLRASNLAHLLAISGLHMGLLTGFVFGAVRVGLAAVPYVALRYPIKKCAALAAFAAGAFYLALSGGNVATERAFIMVAVMLGAVLMDRRALTLRAVAMAAVLILIWQPESLVSPGFQMSFAATTALVAVFAWLRDKPWTRGRGPVQAAASLVISSAVAGLATAPFGAAHFNQIAQFGLIANLTTVPLMGALVIPSAVIAAVLAPLGLAWIPLEVMRWACQWILGVAEMVAGFDASVIKVPAPDAQVLPLLTLGFLIFVLWHGRARWAGPAVVLAGFAFWFAAERPALLISPTGGMVGVMTQDGRALSKPSGDRFVARVWLENDGDPAAMQAAAERPLFSGPRGVRTAEYGGLVLHHITGKSGAAAWPGVCTGGSWVISSVRLDPLAGDPCRLFDASVLSESGAVAVRLTDEGPKLTTAAEQSGRRPWNTPRERPRPF
ncbi:MAG: ComEC/Rec2 family competence protein [Pseudomonadota bacterium]